MSTATTVAPLPTAPGIRWHALPRQLRLARHDPLSWVEDLRERHGPVTRVPLGLVDLYMLSSPQAAEQLLVQGPDRTRKNTRGQRILRQILGQSVLTSDGSEWRWRRRVAQPAFHRRALVHLEDLMRRAAEDELRRLAASGEPVDLFEHFSRLTLRVAAEGLLGVDLSDLQGRVSTALTVVLDRFESIVSSPLPSPWAWPTPANRRFHRALRELDDVVQAVLRRRNEEGEDRADLLGLLLAARTPTGAPLSPAQLRDEILTMLLAGHETTASALSWTIAQLMQHPRWMRAVQQERDEVVGFDPVQMDHLDDLRVTEQALRESMRLHPPAWVLSRQLTEPMDIAGCALPAGSYAFVLPWTIHRDPQLWERPLEFRPERAHPGSRLAWMPFGAGARKCIGEAFAMMEAKITLATLLRDLEFEPTQSTLPEPQPTITLRPRGGLWARVRPRRRGSNSPGEARTTKAHYAVF